MYIPKNFSENDTQYIHDIISKYSFATLIMNNEDGLEISHLPMHFDKVNNRLLGHIARSNQLNDILQSNLHKPVTIIFNAPHGYISPNYYLDNINNVPTWNYAVVHVKGLISLINDDFDLMSILDLQFASYEPSSIDWNNPRIAKMINGIVGFEIRIRDIQAKFKLSQNKSELDQESIIAKLSDSKRHSDVELSEFMQQYRKIKNSL